MIQETLENIALVDSAKEQATIFFLETAKFADRTNYFVTVFEPKTHKQETVEISQTDFECLQKMFPTPIQLKNREQDYAKEKEGKVEFIEYTTFAPVEFA